MHHPTKRAPATRTLTFDRQLPEGAIVLGATVQAFAEDAPAEADGSRWVELAYAVSMVESEVSLSREDFERCVENHKRYPCCPVVIEHADTSWWGEPEWAEPHGYVEELRVGEREVTELDGSKRLAATLEGRVSFLAETAAEVKARKWRFGSITMIKGAVDEATGAGLEALLWSWSLTAHPRLTGLEPIPASRRLGQLSADQRTALRAALEGPAAPPNATPRGGAANSTPEKTTMKFLQLLAALGFAAVPTEEEAEKKVTGLATFAADALRAVGLTPTATPAEFAAKLAELQSAAARTPALETELATFRAERDARAKADRAAYLDDLVAARPELAPVRASLALHAESDFAGFSATYPRPTRDALVTAAAEAAQRAQDPARTTPVTVTAANPVTKDAPAAPASRETLARDLRAVLDEFGYPSGAVEVAAVIAQGHTPATLRAALAAA